MFQASCFPWWKGVSDQKMDPHPLMLLNPSYNHGIQQFIPAFLLHPSAETVSDWIWNQDESTMNYHNFPKHLFWCSIRTRSHLWDLIALSVATWRLSSWVLWVFVQVDGLLVKTTRFLPKNIKNPFFSCIGCQQPTPPSHHRFELVCLPNVSRESHQQRYNKELLQRDRIKPLPKSSIPPVAWSGCKPTTTLAIQHIFPVCTYHCIDCITCITLVSSRSYLYSFFHSNLALFQRTFCQHILDIQHNFESPNTSWTRGRCCRETCQLVQGAGPIPPGQRGSNTVHGIWRFHTELEG